jgi:hypothetical protein
MITDKQVIKDWRGKIIGYIETDNNGNKIVKDFYRKILGRYDKRSNVTKDFYGRLVAKGDQCGLLFAKNSL